MAGLIDKLRSSSPDTEAPPNGTPPATADGAPPAPAPPDVVVPDDASRLCVSCAALLAEGQDWCLECGTAQPGRLGSRPGWRPALTIVALTAVLAVGAVAAAYAALSSDAERVATAPPPPAAEPIVPPAPVQTTPAPADDPAAVPAPEDDAGDDAPADPPADEPADDAADDTAPPPPANDTADDTSPPADDTSGDTDDGESEKPDKPVNPVIALGPDAASTFDPYDRSGGLTGDPADAIDGRRRTKWEAPVGQDGLVNIGLLVSLEQAREISAVRVEAGTPGFNVELYGSKLGTAPEAAPGATKYWKKLDATKDFGTEEKLTAGATYRHVLLWFTEQPADTKVMIPEVELLK